MNYTPNLPGRELLGSVPRPLGAGGALVAAPPPPGSTTAPCLNPKTPNAAVVRAVAVGLDPGSQIRLFQTNLEALPNISDLRRL